VAEKMCILRHGAGLKAQGEFYKAAFAKMIWSIKKCSYAVRRAFKNP
jgi:hypothetical protein